MNTKETKTVIEDSDLNWDEFIGHMATKTVGLYADGSLNYYVWDVLNYIKNHKKNDKPKN